MSENQEPSKSQMRRISVEKGNAMPDDIDPTRKKCSCTKSLDYPYCDGSHNNK